MQLDQRVPDFTLPDLQGRIHILGDYRGRIVVVNFWSAECPYSEQADLLFLSYRHEWREQVVVLTVASNDNESVDLLAAVSRRRKLPVVLRDEGHRVADQFGALTTPHIFIIDGLGLLRYQGAFSDVSLRQRQPARLFAKVAVDALLAGEVPAPASTQPFGCTIVRIMLE